MTPSSGGEDPVDLILSEGTNKNGRESHSYRKKKKEKIYLVISGDELSLVSRREELYLCVSRFFFPLCFKELRFILFPYEMFFWYCFFSSPKSYNFRPYDVFILSFKHVILEI